MKKRELMQEIKGLKEEISLLREEIKKMGTVQHHYYYNYPYYFTTPYYNPDYYIYPYTSGDVVYDYNNDINIISKTEWCYTNSLTM